MALFRGVFEDDELSRRRRSDWAKSCATPRSGTSLFMMTGCLWSRVWLLGDVNQNSSSQEGEPWLHSLLLISGHRSVKVEGRFRTQFFPSWQHNMSCFTTKTWSHYSATEVQDDGNFFFHRICGNLLFVFSQIAPQWDIILIWYHLSPI